MLTEPDHWIILLISFLETWRELGLVHPIVKNQLWVHAWGPQHSMLYTAWALVVSSSFWVFYISTTLLVELEEFLVEGRLCRETFRVSSFPDRAWADSVIISWKAQGSTGETGNQGVKARVSYRFWDISLAVFRCSHLGIWTARDSRSGVTRTGHTNTCKSSQGSYKTPFWGTLIAFPFLVSSPPPPTMQLTSSSEAPQKRRRKSDMERIMGTNIIIGPKKIPVSWPHLSGLDLCSSRAHMQLMHKAQRSTCQTPA